MLLILLSLCLLLLGCVEAQQCKLVPVAKVLTGGNSTTFTAVATQMTTSGFAASASQTVSSTTSSSSPTPVPSLAPFDYGSVPVRGVNL